jgi:predicted small lipoprotein YifL
MRSWRLVVGSSLAALCIASAGCGKKGPPLPPIVHIPSAVDKVEARRRGDEVTVTVTVPSKNIDGTMPVDVARIEVYGFTGTTAPPVSRFLELGTQVGTITVPERKPDAPPDTAPPPGTPVPGGPATIVESLTTDALVGKEIPPAPTTTKKAAPLPVATPPKTAAETGPLRRFYLALPFSPRGRPGPPGMIGELRLTTLPPAPIELRATNLPDAVRLEWEPSGGLIGFLLERALAPELSPLDEPIPDAVSSSTMPAPLQGPTRYNVYRELPPLEDKATTASQPASPVEPALVNSVPIDTLTFTDPLTGLDGRQRCYVVRAMRSDGPQSVEGMPSERICVVPMDDFPPEAPSRPSITSEEGSITLTWEPNAEPDIAGYLVLRGEAGDATLSPVTDTVVTETRFTDRTVKPGVRYSYAVQAIDSRLPRPNVSPESERVEETAR